MTLVRGIRLTSLALSVPGGGNGPGGLDDIGLPASCHLVYSAALTVGSFQAVVVLDALNDTEHAPGRVVVDARELARPPHHCRDRERAIGLDVQRVADGTSG